METQGANNPVAKKAVGDPPAGDPRVFLAAEQNYLAWIRTGISLMGFGFILARFGIFLREFQWMRNNSIEQPFGASIWLGVSLVSIGVAANVAATMRHVQLVCCLREGRDDVARPSRLAITVAVLLAGIGLITAIYLAIVSMGVPVTATQRSSMLPNESNGVISVASNHSVDETVARAQKMLRDKGVMLFALVDHNGEAEKVGMKMRPTKLLIFGNPRAGTPIMIASPSAAIDLPLKLLVWEDEAGRAWVSYNSAEYLRDRHQIPAELMSNVAVVSTLAEKAAEG